VSVADEIEFARACGYDYIKLQPKILMNPVVIASGGDPAAARVEGRWAAEGKGAIPDRETFERCAWPAPESIGYERFEDADRILPDDMGVIGQYGDIFTFVWEALGFQNFSLLIYEDPELIEEMFAKVGAVIYNLFERMVEFRRVEALWYSDDIAYTGGLMLAPEFFREHLFPWMRKIGVLCKNKKIPFIYHSDGVLWEVVEDLVEMGVTSLHPIEPQSMDVGEVKSRVAGRLAVLGSVEVDTLCRGSREEVEALVRDRLRRAAPGGGYCLGSSNSIPDYVNVENYITLLELGDRLGTYPIEIAE